ncbi:radical SAM protein [Catellatospora chokoriensis]|nr:radical SAM protein [Catellatospora chokoriensis]
MTSTYAFQSFNAYNLQMSMNASELGPGPMPFAHFVVKVASRCNIKCTYCYVYEQADRTWITQPRRMSDAIELATIARIGEYLAELGNQQALVILHGGEPLLYGAQRIERFAERLRAECGRRGVDAKLALQTNGTMVDDAWLDVFDRNGIHVGLSLDGPPDVHDAKRRDKVGAGTYERTAEGLRRLLSSTGDRGSPPAVTAVIDPAARPRDVVEHFLGLGVEHVDFQLPDVNHDSYPHAQWPLGTFGAWLIELYEELRRIDRPMRVRSIELLVGLLLGAPYGGDILGPRSFGTLVIDTDGDYHAHDALKATFDGATITGASVLNEPIRSLVTHPMVLAHTDKATAASADCLECPLFSVCGGGLVAHRYSASRQYDNRSVYCTDLAMFIRHVEDALTQWRGDRIDAVSAGASVATR